MVGIIDRVDIDELIYEMNHILNCGYEIKEAMILAIMDAIFAIA